jgi:hypothetical protein
MHVVPCLHMMLQTFVAHSASGKSQGFICEASWAPAFAVQVASSRLTARMPDTNPTLLLCNISTHYVLLYVVGLTSYMVSGPRTQVQSAESCRGREGEGKYTSLLKSIHAFRNRDNVLVKDALAEAAVARPGAGRTLLVPASDTKYCW